MKALARTTPAAAEPVGLFDWWLGELRDLLPGGRSGRGPRRGGLQLRLERPFVRVLGRRGQRLEAQGSFLLPGAAEQEAGSGPVGPGPELRGALERHKDAIVLVMGAEDLLTCTDLLPASAESELARIVAHKIDLLTPWPTEQVYTAHRVTARRADGMLEVMLAVAPRRAVDEVRAQLAKLGIVPAALDVLGEDGQRTAGLDLLHADAPAPRQRLIQIVLGLLVVAALGAAGWAGIQIRQRGQQLAAQRELTAGLDARLADLPPLRERLSALETEAGFLANDRRSRPSPLIVLEVLSRLLPDSVWLTDVRLDERGLVIAGMAEDSSALIPLIESAPEFAEVRFQTPSTRVRVRVADGGEREVERFAIGAAVDPAVEPSL